MAKVDLTPSRLRQVLDYNPATGIFVWRLKLKHSKPIGSVAGTLRGNYLQIGIDRRRYYAHRLAWFYVTGCWPTKQIDHINRSGLDNRIDNLRDVSASTNCRNTKRTNSYGQGVARNRGATWRAQIHINDKSVFLGNYLSAAEAETAFLTVRELHLLGNDSMLLAAAGLKQKATIKVAKTQLQFIVNGEFLSVTKTAIALGIPERTMYYRLNTGRYCALQTFNTYPCKPFAVPATLEA